MESRKKIALCFLTYDNLSQPVLWKHFIKSDYNIYIHNKNNFSGIFKKFCIKNKVSTRWGNISIVNATILLFKEAFETKENEYFVLLSDKCIPLYNPKELYDKINNVDNNIILNYAINRNRHTGLTDKTFFLESEFMKQHQWMILKRDTVKFFIEHDYTRIFGDKFFAPDEHYFINIMNKYKISYINKQATYVNWDEPSDSKKHRELPKTYDSLTNKMIKEILETGCFFMRKISKECKIPTDLISRLSDINKAEIKIIPDQ